MRFRKNIQGMAMLEVLIAMLIFALALIPLVRLQVMSMAATKAGFYKTETAAAAVSMMDYLKTDIGAIFRQKWDKVIVLAGEDCQSMTDSPQKKVACEILNSPNGLNNIHADKNAILCVFGKQPKYLRTGDINDKNQDKDDEKYWGNRDQYLISIRAIWYSGKREELMREEDPDPNNPSRTTPRITYSADLKADDCGSGYDSKMRQSVIENNNIDSIQINMAY